MKRRIKHYTTFSLHGQRDFRQDYCRSIDRTAREFDFVGMSTQEEFEQAINALHGTNFGGRILVVYEAHPPEAECPFRSVPPSTPAAQ